jgi:hypothetical protein
MNREAYRPQSSTRLSRHRLVEPRDHRPQRRAARRRSQRLLALVMSRGVWLVHQAGHGTVRVSAASTRWTRTWLSFATLCRARFRRRQTYSGYVICAGLVIYPFANELVNVLQRASLLTFSDRLPLWNQRQATHSCYPLFMSDMRVLNFDFDIEHHVFPAYHGSGFAKHGR